MLLKEIGERVRLARTNKGITQMQLAKQLQVSPHFLSNIEQGKQTMSIDTLSGICEALDVSADWILRDCTPESRRMTNIGLEEKLNRHTPEERTAMLKLLDSLEEILGFRDG